MCRLVFMLFKAGSLIFTLNSSRHVALHCVDSDAYYVHIKCRVKNFLSFDF